MPRFVILNHDRPSPHWDLMLEDGERLRTWRLAEIPTPGVPVGAKLIGSHRRMYLDYEGPVSGGRGEVSRWDAGTFSWLEDRPERVSVALVGIRLVGRLTLVMAGTEGVALFLDQP